MKRTSCGILVFNAHGELLLCRLTGTRYWDLPKGLGEPGESARDAALRETAEECGLRLPAESLTDLGRFAYRPAKDLHLFAARIAAGRDVELSCSSHFVDRQGRRRPEVDAFRWTPPDDVPRHCGPSLARVLLQIGLSGLPARLVRAAEPGAGGGRDAAG